MHYSRNDHIWKMLIQKPKDVSDVSNTHLFNIEIFWSAKFCKLIIHIFNMNIIEMTASVIRIPKSCVILIKQKRKTKNTSISNIFLIPFDIWMTTTNDNLLLVTIYISWRWFDFWLLVIDCLRQQISSNLCLSVVSIVWIMCHCLIYHFTFQSFVLFHLWSNPIRSIPRCSICFVCYPCCSFNVFPFVLCVLFSSGLGDFFFFFVRFFLTFIPCRAWVCFGLHCYFRVHGIESCESRSSFRPNSTYKFGHFNVFNILKTSLCLRFSFLICENEMMRQAHTLPIVWNENQISEKSAFVLNEQN